jgi:hypothetical protein
MISKFEFQLFEFQLTCCLKQKSFIPTVNLDFNNDRFKIELLYFVYDFCKFDNSIEINSQQAYEKGYNHANYSNIRICIIM